MTSFIPPSFCYSVPFSFLFIAFDFRMFASTNSSRWKILLLCVWYLPVAMDTCADWCVCTKTKKKHRRFVLQEGWYRAAFNQRLLLYNVYQSIRLDTRCKQRTMLTELMWKMWFLCGCYFAVKLKCQFLRNGMLTSKVISLSWRQFVMYRWLLFLASSAS